MTWTLLSGPKDRVQPSARVLHGFESAGGRLYIHGGRGSGEWRASAGTPVQIAPVTNIVTGAAIVMGMMCAEPMGVKSI